MLLSINQTAELLQLTAYDLRALDYAGTFKAYRNSPMGWRRYTLEQVAQFKQVQRDKALRLVDAVTNPMP